MLVDTDVLIWLFRGRESARRAVVGLDTVSLSAVTYMELVQGMRDRDEFRRLRQTIRQRGWTIVPLSEDIGYRATVYVETYALSHGITLADALIAASAVETGMALMSANVKHFKPIGEIELVRYRP